MAQISIGRGPVCHNYYVLRNIFSEQVIEEARSVVGMLPKMGGMYSLTAANKLYAYLDKMPTLVDTLFDTFENLHIIGSNFFCSDPTPSDREELGDWHSGHSLYFGVEGGAAYTLWIPLQDLNEETGGRLKLYNGRYIKQIDDLLDCQVRNIGNSISNDHSILHYLIDEMNEGAVVPDINAGDGLLFDEMLPHQAEKCLIQRNVLAVRMVLGDFKLNEDLIKKVLKRYDEPGEIGMAAEYLENLLEYREYERPDAAADPMQLNREPFPEPNDEEDPTLLQRAKRRIVRMVD